MIFRGVEALNSRTYRDSDAPELPFLISFVFNSDNVSGYREYSLPPS